MTLSVAAIGGNSAIGIYFNEFLKLYLFMTRDSDELSTLDSSSFDVTPIRKKTEAVTYKGSSTNVDPRKSTTTPRNMMSEYSTFMASQLQANSSKLVNGHEEQEWWNSIYEIRSYIMKNQDISSAGVKFKKGFSKAPIQNLNQEIYMNQFCKYVYGQRFKYKKYEDLLWLICSVDGKKPGERRSSEKISQMQKANFPTPEKTPKEKSIDYMTLEQAKKKKEDKAKFSSVNKNKYVVYDYSEEWWKWSYEYRFQKDKADESSAYPLSEKFKKVEKDWDSKLKKESLNKVCKDFYEKASSSADEQEDASRYCSAEGK
ncbi:hypothetical protein MHSWG343_06050 [Candidatus Mycoplasma haematohominis]|uniref:Uncharacterized protein n=2 Tax=Candidatus Mycoplasma haematohominis TaxID=1494318 RepID=A0A478FQ06_9MOLU|nr:hypothetical protein MHSWG343_06050 [Candidatus Mycoplasma haemohominis]